MAIKTLHCLAVLLLINMEKVKIPLNNYDMANIFNAYEDEGIQFFNLYNTISLDVDIDPTLYTTHYYSSTDDWYSLANRYYNNPKLWWVILIANQIVNPFDELQAGTQIKIPKTTLLSDIISHINNKK